MLSFSQVAGATSYFSEAASSCWEITVCLFYGDSFHLPFLIPCVLRTLAYRPSHCRRWELFTTDAGFVVWGNQHIRRSGRLGLGYSTCNQGLKTDLSAINMVVTFKFLSLDVSRYVILEHVTLSLLVRCTILLYNAFCLINWGHCQGSSPCSG